MEQIFTLQQIGERARNKKRRIYVCFMDLLKAYHRVNREALWLVLRIYDVVGKLMNEIKSMYAYSLGESECFRMKSGVRLGCIMSP